MGKKSQALAQALAYITEKQQQCENDLMMLQSIAICDWREIEGSTLDKYSGVTIEFTIIINGVAKKQIITFYRHYEKIVNGNSITYGSARDHYRIFIQINDKYMFISFIAVFTKYDELFQNHILTRSRGDELITFVDIRLQI